MSRRSPRPLRGREQAPQAPAHDLPHDVAVAAARRLLEESYDQVVETVRYVAARNRLTRDTADELRSRVMVHLTSNDYGVLRRWRGDSTLHTYLVTVVGNVYLDLRNQEWGKAKPPAVARREGPVAMLLWRLTHRKRLSFDEAVSLMLTQYEVTATREDLWAMFQQFPPARGRYFVDVNELADREQPGGEADVLVQQRDLDTLASRVDRALAKALDGLTADDQLILKLFFCDGVTRAGIARIMQLDQQRLYPRFLKLLETLQRALEAEGVGAQDVRRLTSAEASATMPAFARLKNLPVGPSQQVEGGSPPAPPGRRTSQT
ncbi:MAG: sigma-70 family RNA polymerase sigma factor [Vicinamibacterales bacterium]